MNITIWNEKEHIGKAYPKGMNEALKSIFFGEESVNVTAVTIDMPSQGLTEETLNNTDVLIWWGHARHDEVEDALVEKIAARVNENGMGVIFLHSAHLSKPFKKLIGASGALTWRDKGERERLYTINPYHPISKGVEQGFVLKHEEMYGEDFDIGHFDDIIFMGWFAGGNIFRSGVTFSRGMGKFFYFQPGHESYPTFYNENVRKIIFNATMFVAKEDIVPSALKPEPLDYKHSGICTHQSVKPESFINRFFKRGTK
jgi:trehalose utilization protein